jgi:hypothetical protein
MTSRPVVDALIQDVVPLVSKGRMPEAIFLAADLYAEYVEQAGASYLPVYSMRELRIVNIPVAPLAWR